MNIDQAVQDADLRVLLMVLFQTTGDRRWLDQPYRPSRDVRLIADEDAGFSADIQAEVRAAAAAVLSAPDVTPAIPDPGDELMTEMMNFCLSEPVPPEYAPMMREQMGFIEDRIAPPKSLSDSRPVAIVGAGASGIALAARLGGLGIPYVVLERNDQVGGTWFENRYPGCAVDTPNHAYSYSWGRRYPWSRYFAPRAELFDYLDTAADEFGVRPHIRFGTEVVQADWRDDIAGWQLTLAGPNGEEFLEARALVSAIGQISQPTTPALKGADDFRGVKIHTARWPEELELAGKRVAIIGTGASSMQIVPEIYRDVEQLSIFQRSPQWVRPIPHYHDPIPDGSQWLLRHVPLYAAWYRFTMLWRYGDGLLPTLRIDPNWPYPDRSLNRANDRHRQEMADHIVAELGDRHDLIEKCLPSYPPYGKRILLDNGWFRVLREANVELVTDDIDRLTAGGIATDDGRTRDFDVIIYATGFKMTLMAARLNIRGRAGLKLEEVWAGENPTAYLGITVPDFPNLFVMQGPSTGLGHGGSAIFQSECQAHYIAACLVEMERTGISAISARQAPLDEFVRQVDELHENMIWSHPGMSTYYRNSAGRVFTVSPFRLVDYWTMTRRPDFDDYEVTRARG